MKETHESPPDRADSAQTVTALLRGCEFSGDGQLVVEPSRDWMQGRSLYGGIQAALAAEAMRPFSEGLPIRTLQATLCAPVPPGRVTVVARVLRVGGSTRQIEARIVDGGHTLALFVGIFGRARESEVARDFVAKDLSDIDGTVMPFIEGMTPDFLKQFRATLLKGHFPGAGKRDTEHVYRVSLLDDAEKMGLAQFLTMSDFPPPVGLSWLAKPTPASTMTWMLNFTGHAFEDQALDDWVIDVSLNAAHDGYTQQTVTLFAPDGYAIARGTQCMVVFG